MKLRPVLLIVMVVAAIAPRLRGVTAQGDDVKAAYDRAESFNRRTQGLVAGLPEAPNFIAGTSKLWYRRSGSGGNEFVLVDDVARTKLPAFDRPR